MSSSPLLLVFHSWFNLFHLSPPGLSQEKVATFIKRLRAEPRYLLAQNVSTCIDPLEVCLHRQTVQDTVHIFQHSIPTEGKPITNQKNSGRTCGTTTLWTCTSKLTAAFKSTTECHLAHCCKLKYKALYVKIIPTESNCLLVIII